MLYTTLADFILFNETTGAYGNDFNQEILKDALILYTEKQKRNKIAQLPTTKVG